MAEEDQTLQVNVSVEDVGPACKRLTIEIDEGQIAERIEDAYSKLRTDAALPGFRKGRAPQRLIEKRFGSSVREDVCGQLLSEGYTQAIEEQKLQVMGEPDVNDQDDIKLPESGPLTFTVEVEVVPDVTLPDLEGIELTRRESVVTAEDVDRELDQLRQQYGQNVVPDDAVAEVDDMIEADVIVFAGHNVDAEAERLDERPGISVMVTGPKLEHKGHVAGIVVDDLGKRLLGKTAGDEVRIEMTGPGGHENERIKDQPITIEMKLGKIHRYEPCTAEALQERLGFDSVDEMRSQVEDAIATRHDRQQTADLHDQICKYLDDQIELELPEAATSRQTDRLIQRQALEMAYVGVPDEEIERRLAEQRQSSEEQAKRHLKLFFIIEKAAADLNIEVTEPEVNGRIAAMAVQQGRRPEKLRQEMHRSGQLEHLFLTMREQKTLDQILAQAKITTADTAEPAATDAEAPKDAEPAEPDKADTDAETPEAAAE